MAAADDRDMNRDPITDEPGAHPVGTGVGAASGAVAGAAAGVIGGPVGMAVGGVIGAVVGGLAGKAAAEAVNPTAEEAHWRENYTKEPYYEQGRDFDDYAPAYRLGMEGRSRYEDDWESAEPKLASEWDSSRSGSGLSWQQAQPASRAAWHRVDRLRTGAEAGTGPAASGTDPTFAGGSAGTMSAGMGSSSMGTTSAAGLGGSTGSTGDTLGSKLGMDSTSSMDSSYVASDSLQSGTSGTGGMSGGSSLSSGSRTGSRDAATGTAGMVGAAQSAGNDSGDTKDVIDALQDLVECCKDGEYGFRTSAEQAQRQDLKSLLQQRAEDCSRGARELNDHIRRLGGTAEDSGSTAGALHRGWVSVKTTLTSYDDKAVLEECERGEDNALARYRKALKQPLPADIKQVVEKQSQGVQRNHDQIKMLRDQFRQAS